MNKPLDKNQKLAEINKSKQGLVLVDDGLTMRKRR
jgi:hypothetical protein